MFRKRKILFAAVAVAVASSCTPFNVLMPDAGDGPSGSGGGAGTDGTAGATSPQADAGADVPLEHTSEEMTTDGRSSNGATNGTACTFDTDCAFGHCVESVCCETACAGKCNSCRKTSTGQVDGKCAPVKEGLSHANDCPASDPTTCGLDGKCDGVGACRYHSAATSCGVESCSDGPSFSSYAGARVCDGHGSCGPTTTSMCGSTYRCSGSKCRTSCALPQDCIPAAYCSGSTCFAKKPDKELCSSANECTSGVCGGRCCAVGCTCTQPNVLNVLANAGLDTDAAGWSAQEGTLTWTKSDAEQCPYSGSVVADVPIGTFQRILSVCAGNRPLVGDFNFGFRFNYSSDGQAPSDPIGQANFYSGFNCDGDLVGQNETYGHAVAGSWLSVDGAVQGVSGANSVELTGYLLGSTTANLQYKLDMVYVSKAPMHY